MKEPFIRRAVLPDLPYLYEICLKTGDSGKDATHLYNDPYIVGQYFSAPYLLFPDGIVFVVEYECRPQGYIVSAPNTEAYRQWMEEVWLPPLRTRYPQPYEPELIRSERESWLLGLIHKKHLPIDTAAEPWFKDYPAHLHIDLLPRIQGKGLGRGLMNQLFAELKRQGVPGIQLGVSKLNTGAVAFYNKIGFSVLLEREQGFTVGKLMQ